MPDYGATERVRQQAAERYVAPARARGESTLSIHSGEFGKELVQGKLLAPARFPIVCGALGSTKFQEDNRLTLIERKGPASGKSSTVTFTYQINGVPNQTTQQSAFDSLRGILKGTYKALGGAERFHRVERQEFER